MRKLRKVFRLALLFGFVGSFSGCGTVYYLFQAGKGQLALLNHARPIPEVIKDEKTPPRTKKLLSEIESIKKFGEREGLRPTSNYREYVHLDRSAAVWVVSACDELRFKSKEWSFPIVGSFPYLGWFDRKDAENYKQELEKEGLDVDLRGAAAYSTLGWFPDAVLSTMLPKGEEALGELINIVLHESAHATIYVKGQAYFNESVASFIADGLTQMYLNEYRGIEAPEKLAYQKSEERSREMQKKLHAVYKELESLYASNKQKSEKLEEKQKILNRLSSELDIKRKLNNATLVQYKTYNTGQEDFEKLFKAFHSKWPVFIAKLKTLKPSAFPKPQQDEFGSVLEGLVPSHTSVEATD